MATNTPNYDLIKPGVNDPTDQDLWGGYLNEDMDIIDTTMKSISDQADLSSPATNAQSGNYTVQASDQNKMILVDATGGDITITLLAAATAGNGFRVGVKKIDSSSNTVTIEGAGSETIDGELNVVYEDQYQAAVYITNGTAWFIENTGNVTSGAGTQVTQTAGQVIPLDTPTILNFNSTIFDDDGWHDEVTQNSRITVNFDGRIMINVFVDTDIPANGILRINLLKNGSTIRSSTPGIIALSAQSGYTINGNMCEVLEVSSGDYFQVQLVHLNPSTTTTIPAGTFFTASRIK